MNEDIRNDNILEIHDEALNKEEILDLLIEIKKL